MKFQRRHGESIDESIARFELARAKAGDTGGLGMTVQTWSWIVLTKLGIPNHQGPMLLDPFIGWPPQSAADYIFFVMHKASCSSY